MPIKYFILLFLFSLTSCGIKNKNITLKEWLEDKERWETFYAAANNNDCQKQIEIAQEINVSEFKKNTYVYLAMCYLESDTEKTKEYLIKSVANGNHPNRIDSLTYSSVYGSIKKKMIDAHHTYWSSIDTTYFAELEERTKLDQSIRVKAMSNPADTAFIHVEMRKIDKDNQAYLLDQCKNKGFPLFATPNYFNTFRRIDPTIIVGHAKDSLKLIFLDYAIEAAETGEISWFVPISISDLLFVSGISYKEVHPLWNVFFDNNRKLNLDKSYLQLYSIKNIYGDKKIIIQPSLYNTNNKTIINEQLTEIENTLINEFSIPPQNIEISSIPNDGEEDHREISPYHFTLSIN